MRNCSLPRRIFLVLVPRFLMLLGVSLILSSPLSVSFAAPFEVLPDSGKITDYTTGGPILLKGEVVDEKGQPLPGVTVQDKATREGTVTAADGLFSLSTTDDGILEISYIGYQSQQFAVKGKRRVVIHLKPSASSLNELVVVGYAKQERKSVIGSLSEIDAAQVRHMPVASFDAQLQGQAAGVQVNSQSGMPGESVKIRIRGSTSINASNDPLYIVDGTFINSNTLSSLAPSGNGIAGPTNLGEKTTSPLADIAPSDIESMEVLKDAEATAIYGSRGANGVVIITTRRSQFNAPAKVSFNASYGLAAVQKSRLWKVATGPQHALIANETWINSGIDDPSLNQTAANEPFQRAPDGTFNPGAPAYRGDPSDQKSYSQKRLDQVLRTAVLQDYALSVGGGSSTTRYYIGSSYTRQEAILRPANFNRSSVKANMDSKLSDKVRVGISNLISRTFRRQLRAGNGPDAGIFQSALQTPSYLPTNDADGTPLRWANFDNTEVLVKNAAQSTTSLHYIGNVYLDATLFSKIKFHSSLGIDYDNYREAEYYNSKTQIGAATNGEAKSNITQLSEWVNEQTLSYDNGNSGKNNFGILVGNTVEQTDFKADYLAGTGFPSDAYKLIAAAANRSASQDASRNALTSFFSRIHYNYAGKYYLEATGRADGSSKFGSDHRWGYFPAIGAAWRISEEPFLQNVRAIDNLKLRVSYGISGNQNGINDFAAKGLWAGSSGYPDDMTSGDKAGTAPLQLANPDLRWETTRQLNVGIDLGLLNERLDVEVNLYSKFTKGALLNLPVPSSSGFKTQLSNSGEISNKGYELRISTVNIKTREFTWNTDFNISGNVNKIRKLATPITFYNRDWLIDKQGYAMYSFWLYKQLYVDPETGNAVFRKADGSTSYSPTYSKNITLSTADRMVIGNAMPKFFGGVTNSFTYKGFDAGVFFSFQYGNKLINYNRFLGEKQGQAASGFAGRFITESQMARWTTPGQKTDVPRVTSVGNNYLIEQNSRFLEDGSFLRLKTFTLGYTLPSRVTSRLRVDELRFYLQGTNLWLLTRYSGPDPEINVNSDQNAPGLDQGTPPQPRSLQVGLNLTL